MEAFEKIRSGIPEMDAAFDSLRLGDNVVFQVGELEEFRAFARPFVAQALADGKTPVYIRFASHPPLVAAPGLAVRTVELSHHFETFTMAIHRIIEETGRGAFYVFDCLSELQTAWSTDMMMGNFFRVICPFLFRLDTVAYFPILRGCHSFAAVAGIRDTTQVLLDVFPGGAEAPERLYVHPLKMWKRYSPTMFLPHGFEPERGTFRPLTDGVSASRFYTMLNAQGAENTARSLDAWDRIFLDVQNRLQAGTLRQDDLRMLCRIMMTRDEKLRELVDRYFTAEDYLQVRSRMIGTGLIGGKACGMLLARRIAARRLGPEDTVHFEPHDSYYIGADVFYTYLVDNNCWDARVKQRTEEGYFAEAPALADAIRAGSFSSGIREQFRRLLDYFGQSPIIVRSSSILEDGFGNAFAGKYDSVFCANAGSPEERLTAFETAVRTVYASTMDRSALEYRQKRGLWQRDEQMALLVQRVSGSYYGTYFFPDAAGVGYSFSIYRLREDMDVRAGMLRLVMGLGTRAVNRPEGDYPRLIHLAAPTVTLQPTAAERHRYSQQGIDVIELPRGFAQTRLEKLLPLLPAHVLRAMTSHDTDAEQQARERDDRRQVLYISCEGLLHNAAFTGLMTRLLRTLQEEYDHPVDIEFTVNLGPTGDFVMNLLQCRPLQAVSPARAVRIPPAAEADTLLHIRGASMGASLDLPAGYVVCVDPQGYYSCPYANKARTAGVIGRINSFFKGKNENLLLLVPGRIGTSSPELGVPVSFADISEFRMIGEVSYSQAGYTPELSYGSHMFQDLVENDILYGAVFENEKTLRYDPDFLAGGRFPDRFSEICPQDAALGGIVRVYDVHGAALRVLHDAVGEELLIARLPEPEAGP